MTELTSDDSNPLPDHMQVTQSKSTNAHSMLSIAIKDKHVLYATYMSFIKPDAGLFIPTKREFNPGERLSLSLTILDEPAIQITGKVIWVTPKGVHGAKAPGAGVQFEGSKAKELNTKIRHLLSLDLQSTQPTYTM